MTTLSNVYWIGGTSGSGKSTVSTLLSARTSLPVYRADDYEEGHEEQITRESHPNWWFSLNTDYMTHPADELARVYMDECQERLDFVLQDVSNNPNPGLLVDGGPTEPNSLIGAGVSPKRCAFLILNAEARAARWQTDRRDMRDSILSSYDDQEAAWRTWMERDQLVATQLNRSARTYEMLTVEVDDSSRPSETAAAIAEHFGLD